MDVYVARQPIFKKNKKIFGYELLFRGGMDNVFPAIDGDTATSKLLSNTFFAIGMEKLTGAKSAFINFTENLILHRVPLMFPRERVVVEVLEDVRPDAMVVEACKEIRQKGYPIALDDFFYHSDLDPLIATANIIKFDFRAMPLEEVAACVKNLSNYHLDLLAEKVETYEEFEKAREMGFDFFQGYFFSKPEIIRGRDISTPQMHLLEIMAEANRDDFEFSKLEEAIARDVSISYKLMRYINSSFFRRVEEISSIKQAIVLLGERGIRRFISLLVMSKLASDKPDELVRASIIRAKFCEMAGEMNGSRGIGSELFTLGLFSNIDAILDERMEDIMKKLPLSSGIKDALVSGTGKWKDYLKLVVSYEKGEWNAVSETAGLLGLKESALPDRYLEAVEWAESLSRI